MTEEELERLKPLFDAVIDLAGDTFRLHGAPVALASREPSRPLTVWFVHSNNPAADLYPIVALDATPRIKFYLSSEDMSVVIINQIGSRSVVYDEILLSDHEFNDRLSTICLELANEYKLLADASS